MKCVLCNEDIKPNAVGWDEGNNAEPLAEGRCCDACNKDVILRRISYRLDETIWETPDEADERTATIIATKVAAK